MKHKAKKVISCLLAASLIAASLGGCAGKGKDDSNKKGDKSAKGRYLEEDYTLPLNVSDIMAMQKLEDGKTLRMAAVDKEKSERWIWESTDNGKTWEPKAAFPESLRSSHGPQIMSTSISPKGQLVIGTMALGDSPENTGLNYIWWDLETGEKPLQIKLPEIAFPEQDSQNEASFTGDAVISAGSMDNQITTMQFTPEGELLGSDYMGAVYHFDTVTGEVSNDFKMEGSYISSWEVIGGKLIAVTEKEVQIFDFKTGDPLASDEVLNEQINGKKKVAEDGVSVIGAGGFSQVFLTAGKEEDSMFFGNNKGVYRHVIGGNVVEQVVNGALNSLSNPSIQMISMLSLNNDDFLVSVIDENGESRLLNYHYSKAASATPEIELKVYSLEDNQGVRQAIALFQKENPDIFVNYEVGITGDDAVTAADALRTLNTDIMAGKGPDVLVLDGMPTDSYIDKGLLADLTDVIGKVAKEDGFFENVKDTYKKDGKIYAIPTRFGVPAIQGDEETVANATDLKALADQVEKLREKNPDKKSIVNADEAKVLLEKLFYTSSSAWVQKDGTLDEKALKEFLTQAKRIYDVNDRSVDENAAMTTFAVSSIGGGMSQSMLGLGNGSMQMMMKEILVNIGNMGSAAELSSIVSAEQMSEGSAFGWLSGQSQNVYVPMTSVGINTKSKQAKAAEKFIALLLSKESQQSAQGAGFPINQAAYQSMQENPYEEGTMTMGIMSSEDGQSMEIKTVWPTAEEFVDLKSKLETLDTPAASDEVMKSCILEQGENYLNGDQSIDDAVENIIQKVNLYLAE